ncbi:hypothetical protein ABKV19_016306 [Rosa sericea]
MRTILVICAIGFVLMVSSLQADAKRFVLNDRHLVQVKNEPTLASGGAKDQSQSQPRTTNKGSSNSDAKYDDLADDDANETYGKHGHGSSESDSHRYFTDDTFRPH